MAKTRFSADDYNDRIYQLEEIVDGLNGVRELMNDYDECDAADWVLDLIFGYQQRIGDLQKLADAEEKLEREGMIRDSYRW